MLHWGFGLVAVIIPVQLFFGHLTGEYVLKYQPAKFAAIEARWKNEQPASETLIAIPDSAHERNLFAISVPKLGSMIASGSWTAPEVGLESFPQGRPAAGRHPVLRLSPHGGMGLLMLAVSWLGNLLRVLGRLETARWFLWGTFLSFPDRLHRYLDRLVYGRSWTPAVGCLRHLAHQGCGNAIARHRRRAVLAGRLHRGVRVCSCPLVCTISTSCCAAGPTGAPIPIPGATPHRPLAFADDAATATGNQPAKG